MGFYHQQYRAIWLLLHLAPPIVGNCLDLISDNDISNYLLLNSSPWDRPVKDATKTINVQVDVYIQSIVEVDQISRQITLLANLHVVNFIFHFFF